MFSIVFFFMLAVVASAAISVFLRQKALGTLAGLVIFIGGMAFSSFTVISAGHTGVVVTLGVIG